MPKFNQTTPILIVAKESAYVPGEGLSTVWLPITSNMAEQVISTFYCEWRGSYGERSLSAQALGVNDSAIVRMTYNPAIYAALRLKQAVIVKNADETALETGEPSRENPNVYELWGGVDNVAEENQFMEFRVRRYEGK